MNIAFSIYDKNRWEFLLSEVENLSEMLKLKSLLTYLQSL